jgi:hypothetical protein
MMARVLRGIAILIALLAILDPAITTERATLPQVAIVAATEEDSALAQRTAEELDGSYDVVIGPFTGASASVIVGRTLPEHVSDLAAPVFAVLDDRIDGTVTIEAIHAPQRASLESRVPVRIIAHVRSGRGRRVSVSLLSGAVTSESVTQDIVTDDVRLDLPLSFIPTDTGVAALRVSATIDGGEGALADVAVEIDSKPYRVLFYDPRPSWMSTFVRRVAEQDARFEVSSRTITSRDISTDIGQPPSLDDADAIAPFDVIVVGAPEGLRERDVRALDTFMRRRGGSVILLLDRRVDGPHDRLTGVTAWRLASHDRGVSIDPAGPDSSGLRASEITWPAALPANARLVAHTGAPAPSADPVVWETAVGAGRLLVSGALDAWRFRDAAASGFDDFWTRTLAGAAAAAPSEIDVRLERPVLTPGSTTEVIVTLREASLEPPAIGETVRAVIAATLESAQAGDSLRLWPDGPVGTLRGTIRAPNEPGVYRVVVSGEGYGSGSASLLVMNDAHSPAFEEPELVAMWASAHGGSVVPATEMETLPGRMASALPTESRRVAWHPMRSGWWIIPFALALGAEWWWRRRRGFA